jgi:O-antigen/teichoic acid export membrane protein
MKPLMLHKYLRLTPFDTFTEQGRSDERYRLAVLSMVANVLSRGAAMAVMVMTISLTVPYLGAERFGVWMTIASFAGMLVFLDLGIGNALTNKVAQGAAQYNPERLRKVISGGLGFLFLIGCGVGVLLMALFSFLPWQQLIKVGNPLLHAEIRSAALLFAGLFGLHIFANGIQRIFTGMQRAFEGHLASTMGSIVTLLLLWGAVRQESGIPALLAITLGMQSIASLALIVLLYKRGQFGFPGLLSNIHNESPHLLQVGGLFLLLQIGVMVGWGADSLIIASNLGAEQVAVFAIVQRLFQLASQPMNIINSPLWGAYADAHAKNDKVFIGKTLKLSLITTLAYTAFVAILLVFAGDWLVNNWTGNAIQISFGLLLAYACWAILEAAGNALSMFMNGCGIVKQQVITVIVFSIVSIAVKFLMIRNFGLEAMVFGTVITYAIITSAAYGFFFRKTLIEKMK